MRTERKGIFETNSSSTHALSLTNKENDYIPKSDKIIIQFVNTDDDIVYSSLKEKVSYLVGHIINHYKWDCLDYEDLIDNVKKDYDFKRIQRYVYENFRKEIVFPKEYKGELEEIVNINHQLLNDDLDSLLQDMMEYRDYLAEYFEEDKSVVIGRG